MPANLPLLNRAMYKRLHAQLLAYGANAQQYSPHWQLFVALGDVGDIENGWSLSYARYTAHAEARKLLGAAWDFSQFRKECSRLATALMQPGCRLLGLPYYPQSHKGETDDLVCFRWASARGKVAVQLAQMAVPASPVRGWLLPIYRHGTGRRRDGQAQPPAPSPESAGAAYEAVGSGEARADEAAIDAHILLRDDLINDRLREYADSSRRFLLDEIDKFVGSRTSGYLVIKGVPGIGKTAFVAWLARHNRVSAYHFNTALDGVNTYRHFAGNVAAQLIRSYSLSHITFPPRFDEDGVFLTQLIKEAARSVSESNKLIIAVDAIDEVADTIAGHGSNVLFLPANLPRHVYCILTCRVEGAASIYGDPLSEYQIDPCGRRNMEDVQRYICGYLPRPGIRQWIATRQPRLSETEFVDRLSELSEGNFMYLHHVLPAIDDGPFKELDLRELPRGLKRYYQQHWKQMQAAAAAGPPELYERILCVLAVASSPPTTGAGARGVTESDLVRWTGYTRYQVRKVLARWAAFLHEEAVAGQSRDRRYRIYHAAFREFLADEIDEDFKGASSTLARSIKSYIKRRPRKRP